MFLSAPFIQGYQNKRKKEKPVKLPKAQVIIILRCHFLLLSLFLSLSHTLPFCPKHELSIRVTKLGIFLVFANNF